jgi:hypothetical protein
MLSITTHQWICANTYIVLAGLLVQVERVMPGLWSRNKRYSFRCWLSRLRGTDSRLSGQARYFKGMIKAAGHASAVSRLRVTAQQLAPLVPFYHVSYADLYLVSRFGSSKALGCTCTIEGHLYAHVLKMAGVSLFWSLELAGILDQPKNPEHREQIMCFDEFRLYP